MKRKSPPATGKPTTPLTPDELSKVSGGSHQRREPVRPRYVDEARIRHRQGSE
ncbi:hypothetical protein [Legionella erythra]|uniref:Uncharacterized protein n=1 Tax=Legionella erythra TaxID=448 RepID=A0A0W0TVJ2_LEGER|nr:hypothetical protein [Legionella erythra]KTC99631.1 hypothetical protein Lery_0532 [Legionella erythra]